MRSRFFFFNDTATTEIYTLSLHDALPISPVTGTTSPSSRWRRWWWRATTTGRPQSRRRDRKSTRLNSSHTVISYAVFCLKKKKMTVLGLNVPEMQFENDCPKVPGDSCPDD